ncbi:hypothetical protein IJU97_00825 [bacterium]|nr:hypothetical protein [bacterium]
MIPIKVVETIKTTIITSTSVNQCFFLAILSLVIKIEINTINSMIHYIGVVIS